MEIRLPMVLLLSVIVTSPVAGYERLIHNYTENVPGMHGIVKKMRAVLDEEEFGHNRMMIGEIYPDNVSVARINHDSLDSR